MPHEYTPRDAVRFWAKVDKTGECWLWTAATNGWRDYGKFGVRTPNGWRMVYAHRVAYELAHGPIPPGMEVCHRCDTPRCCRAAHLFLGTHQDNMADAKAKGRTYMVGRFYRCPPGERSPHAKLKDADIPEIRALCASGLSQYVVAQRYGVSRSSVEDIVHRKTWKHIA